MRTRMRGLALAAGVTAGAVLASAGAAGPAVADPGVPAATDIVSAGSETTQAFDNGLSAAYNATDPASKYYSWDATGYSPIMPKAGAQVEARPSNDAAGINLLNSVDHNTVDIARASRGPNPGTSEWFIPFAEDGVGWAAYTGGNAPHDLTSADLTAIFSCEITSWNQITDEPGYTGPNAAIDVFVPQYGSGTGTFFQSALGITNIPSCWKGPTPQEDEGTDPVFAGDVNAVFPYSLGHYVGQVYDGRGSGSDQPGVLDANRSIDGMNQIDAAAKAYTANWPPAYTRDLYHVVRQSDWADPAEGPRLKALLDRSVSNGWLCANGTSLLTSYGFRPLARGCGTLQAGG